MYTGLSADEFFITEMMNSGEMRKTQSKRTHG